MKAQDIIKTTLATTNMVTRSYLGDLSDSDLLVRPGAGCNHIAWQLGHLLSSGNQMLQSVAPEFGIQLPEGFAEKHASAAAGSDDPGAFYSKEVYLSLFDQLDAAITAAIDRTTESDLDQPAPESLRAWFPTVGHVYVLLATHSLMHAGQWVPVRRSLGKPVVI